MTSKPNIDVDKKGENETALNIPLEAGEFETSSPLSVQEHNLLTPVLSNFLNEREVKARIKTNEARVLAYLFAKRQGTPITLEDGRESVINLPGDIVEHFEEISKNGAGDVQGYLDLRLDDNYLKLRTQVLTKIKDALDKNQLDELVKRSQEKHIVVEDVLLGLSIAQVVLSEIIPALLLEAPETVWRQEIDSNREETESHNSNSEEENEGTIRSIVNEYIDKFDQFGIYDRVNVSMVAFYKRFSRIKAKYLMSTEKQGVIESRGKTKNHRMEKYTRGDFIKVLYAYDVFGHVDALSEKELEEITLVEAIYREEMIRRQKEKE